MSEKWQYHVSGALTMAKCGYRWYRENVEGIRYPTRTVLATGTGVDRSVGANLGHKIETGELLPVEQVQQTARDNTAAALAGGFELDEDEQEIGAEAARGLAIDKAVRLATAHSKLVAPNLNPSHVARKFCLDVKGYDFQLAGEIDIRETEPGVQAGVIRDTKTRKGRAPKGDEAETSSQLTMYAMAEYALEGRLPAMLALDFLVDYEQKPGRGAGREAWEAAERATGEPPQGVWMPQTTDRETADFGPLLERFQLLEEARQRGVFYPADPTVPGQWWCSKKFCPHWSDCRFVRKPTTTGGGLVQIANTKGGEYE